MCHEAFNDIQLECASLSWREAADELQFASNILTAYNDVAATDYNLRNAIRAHLETRDLRWEHNRPEIPDTPETHRPRDHAPTTADGDWDDDFLVLRESPMSKISVHTELKPPRPAYLRRSSSLPVRATHCFETFRCETSSVTSHRPGHRRPPRARLRRFRLSTTTNLLVHPRRYDCKGP